MVAITLWNVFGFENLLAAVSTETLYVIYVSVGLFTLGFLPGVLFSKYRLRAPIVLIAALFTMCAAGTWQLTQSGVTPVDPPPFGWYILLWAAVGVVAVVSGWLEILLRRRNGNYA